MLDLCLNKWDMWTGWSQYADVPQSDDPNFNKQTSKTNVVLYAFVDAVLKQNLEHQSLLSYNSEGNHNQNIENALSDILFRGEIDKSLSAKCEYYLPIGTSQEGLTGDKIEIQFYNINQWLGQLCGSYKKGYSRLAVVSVQNLGPHQFVLG